MMKPKCREMEEVLAPYVDGEATPEQRASVAAHVEACPPCRERLAEERAARDVLRARRSGLRACASEALRARCAAHAPGRRPARFLGRRTLLPLSLAASVLLAVAGAFIYSVNNPAEALAAQLTVDHVKCFEITADERATDARAAARAWAERRGWSIGVPPGNADAALELVGIRRCASTRGINAHLMYRWRGEPLSVYILPTAFEGARGVQRIFGKLGHEAVIWSEGARTYLVMTRGRPADFDAVVSYIRRHVN